MAKEQAKILNRTLEYLINTNHPYGQRSQEVHKNLKVAENAFEQHLALDHLAKDGLAELNYEINELFSPHYELYRVGAFLFF